MLKCAVHIHSKKNKNLKASIRAALKFSLKCEVVLKLGNVF